MVHKRLFIINTLIRRLQSNPQFCVLNIFKKKQNFENCKVCIGEQYDYLINNNHKSTISLELFMYCKNFYCIPLFLIFLKDNFIKRETFSLVSLPYNMEEWLRNRKAITVMRPENLIQKRIIY